MLGIIKSNNIIDIKPNFELKNKEDPKIVVKTKEIASLQIKNEEESSIYNLNNRLYTELNRNNQSLEEIESIFYNSNVLSEKLKRGDILIKYTPNNSNGIEIFNPVNFFIRNLQKFTKLYTKTSTSYSENFEHAALYVGDGKIVEVIGNGVRQINLDSQRIKLLPEMTFGYVVIRISDTFFRGFASKFAENCSAKGEELSIHKYSVKKGIKGSISSSEFKDSGLQTFLKAAAFARNPHIKPKEGSDNQRFYCSQFVMWCLQAAESIKVISEINKKLPMDKQIIIPVINNLYSCY